MSSLHTSGHRILDSLNNDVYLRGWGRAKDVDGIVGNWWGPGSRSWNGEQWVLDFARQTLWIDATLDAMWIRYKSNAIRMFCSLNWWAIDNVRGKDVEPYYPEGTSSYRDYFALVAQRALLKGMYVIFCPYNYFSGGSAGGVPSQNGLSASEKGVMDKFGNSGDATYRTAFRNFWQTVVNKLGQYPNVLFETFNEPESDNTVKQQFFTISLDMYQIIRNAGCQNIVLFAWRMNFSPDDTEKLRWIPELYNQLKTRVGTPINVAFDWHAYRFVWHREWSTTYLGVFNQLFNDQDAIPITRSATCVVPVIMGEGGPAWDAPNIDEEMDWFDSLVKVCRDYKIGFFLYYWIHRGAWGGPDQGMLNAGNWVIGETGPSPNRGGQIWIDNAPSDGTFPLTVQSNVAVPVTVNGFSLGNTPVTVQVAPGPHIISVPPEVDT